MEWLGLPRQLRQDQEDRGGDLPGLLLHEDVLSPPLQAELVSAVER